MQYTEVKFAYSFSEEYQMDLFLQGLGDLGFESFTDDAAYIQTDMLDEDILRRFAIEQGQTIVSIEAIPDQNWNAEWEAEHPIEELPMGVRIIPHCAFGAGHHETTGMMIDALMACPRITHSEVLDMGCGTGVLGIFAARLGAKHVTAVDIDDHSVSNTQENALLNDVQLDVYLSSVPPQGVYDLILANIHRNILLAQMEDYARYLKPGGMLWLSGFYEEDIPPLTEAAAKHGIILTATHARGDWRMIELEKRETL